MSKFSLNLSDELDELVNLACFLSGRSRNAACVDWILRGVLEELERFERAGVVSKTIRDNPPSTFRESNGDGQSEEKQFNEGQ
jgi:hypothetical protein